MGKLKSGIRYLISALGLISLFYIRTFDGGNVYDFVTAPFLVVFILAILKGSGLSFLNRIMIFVGKHSENIWLTHSFCCYYFSAVVKFVFRSRNYLLAFIFVVMLSLLMSLMIDAFYGAIKRIMLFCQNHVKKQPA